MIDKLLRSPFSLFSLFLNMYFHNFSANNWVLKDAFDEYYNATNGDFAKTNDKLKRI
jgi:hypothetical protein